MDDNKNEVSSGVIECLSVLTKYAHKLTKNEEEAEDLTQECVKRALEKQHLFKPGTNLRAWLCCIMHNIFISKVRKKGKTIYLEDVTSIYGDSVSPYKGGNQNGYIPSMVSQASQFHSVLLREINVAIKRLPIHQRAILKALVMDELSYEDAATKLNIPVGTVKSVTFRARMTLEDVS